VALSQPAARKIKFHTLSGELVVEESEDGAIFMNFPADPPVEIESVPRFEAIAKAIGSRTDSIVRVEVSNQLGYVVIEVHENIDLARLTVDSQLLVCAVSHQVDIRACYSRRTLSRVSPP
jgi:predicted PhzF superfamily epimerase YddE/YHI9